MNVSGAVFNPNARKKKKSKRAERSRRLKEVGEESCVSKKSNSSEYSYEEMLTRLYKTMHDSLGSSIKESSKIKIPPVECYQVGVRKTLWVNFKSFCDAVNRKPEHVFTFLEIELGIKTSVDMDKRLVIKAKFYPKEIIVVVRRYLHEYVICKTCGCRETTLKREQKILFLQCCSKACGSQRSVAMLDKGYTHNLRRR